MTVKFLAPVFVLSMLVPAVAEEQLSTPASPAVLALSQMIQEAQGREAQALARTYAAQMQIKALQDQLLAANKRANDAEAKLPRP